MNGNDFLMHSQTADNGLCPSCFLGANKGFEKTYCKLVVGVAENVGTVDDDLTIIHTVFLGRGVF